MSRPNREPSGRWHRIAGALNPLTFPSRFVRRWFQDARDLMIGPGLEFGGEMRRNLRDLRGLYLDRDRWPRQHLPSGQVLAMMGFFSLLTVWGVWLSVTSTDPMARIAGVFLIAQGLTVVLAGVFRLIKGTG